MNVGDIRKLTKGCEILLVKKENDDISIRYISSEQTDFDDEIVIAIDVIDHKLFSLMVKN